MRPNGMTPRKVWQREKLGEKSGANRKVGHNVGKREKWGEKSEARKVGYKVGREKWCDISGARNLRCETSGAQSGE